MPLKFDFNRRIFKRKYAFFLCPLSIRGLSMPLSNLFINFSSQLHTANSGYAHKLEHDWTSTMIFFECHADVTIFSYSLRRTIGTWVMIRPKRFGHTCRMLLFTFFWLAAFVLGREHFCLLQWNMQNMSVSLFSLRQKMSKTFILKLFLNSLNC